MLSFFRVENRHHVMLFVCPRSHSSHDVWRCKSAYQVQFKVAGVITMRSFQSDWGGSCCEQTEDLDSQHGPHVWLIICIRLIIKDWIWCGWWHAGTISSSTATSIGLINCPRPFALKSKPPACLRILRCPPGWFEERWKVGRWQVGRGRRVGRIAF